MVFVWDFDNVGSFCSEPEEWLFLLELSKDNWRLLEDGISVDSIPGSVENKDMKHHVSSSSIFNVQKVPKIIFTISNTIKKN